jgi:serine/threonine-protein kinase
MAGIPDVFSLLEEMLDSGRTPEEVCRDCPELLTEVRRRWKAFRLVDGAVGELFPETPWDGGATVAAPDPGDLPKVPGYRVEALLGSGGMGVVYRAWHLRLNRAVALKMLLAGPSARPQELERFRREAQAVAGLGHANIVQVHDIGDVEGRPFFTMELVEGGNLSDQIRGVPQPAHQAAALVATLAEAIHAAHESGIVHRDLKPGNILLTKSGTPKVTDFGLARQMEGEGRLTMSGVPVGTPSYMAPEQAEGHSSGIGPATDVYALGAILYEMLTGRPPFQAKTSAATIQQVLAHDPVRPSRLNPRVPRDLETICLKCLHKDSRRRYASARDLADDLVRFLKDEPIRARPVGRWERSQRWLRRRPALVAGLVAAVLLAICFAGGGLWLTEQAALAHGVEKDLQEATLEKKKFAWAEAAAALERAKGRLGFWGTTELHRRVEQAAQNLEQARRDVPLAARLEVIRLNRATHVEGYFDSAAERRFTDARADRDYEQAFREAGLAEISMDPAAAAARVCESELQEVLTAGLLDWAVCAVAPERQDSLLAVICQTDRGAWGNRVFNPAVWRDGPALTALSRQAPLNDREPLLIALAQRLQATGGDASGFLRQVCRQHPADFWFNFVLGNALREENKPEEAAAYYRKALEIRDEAAVYNNLGLAQYDAEARDRSVNWGKARDCFEKALRLDARSAAAHNNLGLIAKVAGLWDKAEVHFRLALQLDPGSSPAHCNLGFLSSGEGHMAEAIEHLREAARLDSGFALARYYLGMALVCQPPFDIAYANHQSALRDDPTNKPAYDMAYHAAYVNAVFNYQTAIGFDPRWAPSQNVLGPRSHLRLADALKEFDRALETDPRLIVAEAARGQAFLAQGRLTEALTATRHSLDVLAEYPGRAEPRRVNELRRNLPIQLRHCERLLSLERRLPAVLRQEDKPPAAERLEFAEVCAMKGRYADAGGLYADAFAAASDLAEDLDAGHRYEAACAAALAGFGRDADGAGLSVEERGRWRRHAQMWLRADMAAWTQKLDTGAKVDRELVQRVSARWWADPGLGWLHEPDALKELSATERQECLKLWQDFEALVRRAHAGS